ncbi:MAG: hypothetical protein R3C28_29775 [Pirellulaceae bacterium]
MKWHALICWCLFCSFAGAGQFVQTVDDVWNDQVGPAKYSFEPFDTFGGLRTLEGVSVRYVGEIGMTVQVENFDPVEYFDGEWQLDAYVSVLVGFDAKPNFEDGGPFFFLGGASQEGITGYLSAGSGGGPFGGTPGKVTVRRSFSATLDSVLESDSLEYFQLPGNVIATVGPFSDLVITPPIGGSFLNAFPSELVQAGKLSLIYDYVVHADFNEDDQLDTRDIDELYANFGTALLNPYDLTDDSAVDQADVDLLVYELLSSVYGDSNLDGKFDSSDLVQVFQAGEFEDAVVANSTYATGDWNGDQEFNTSDLVFVFQQGDFRNQAIPVPEGNATSLLLMAVLTIIATVRRSWN